MAVLAVILFASFFFGSLFVVGMSGNPYNLVALSFAWILIGILALRIRAQRNDPVENIYLIKEIKLQLGVILLASVISFLLRYNQIVTQDISNLFTIFILISCGFVMVDTYTFHKNK